MSFASMPYGRTAPQKGASFAGKPPGMTLPFWSTKKVSESGW